MVAITVILAAVIATFVLGLGEQINDTTPNANFQADFESDASSVNNTANGEPFVAIQHQSGDQIEVGELRISGDVDFDSSALASAIDDDTFAAGDSFSIGFGTSGPGELNITSGSTPSINEGDEIQVVFQSESGSGSILRTFEVPRDYDAN